MTFVERYHGPLRRVFTIIKSEISSHDDENILQLAVRSIHHSASPDDLVPTLPVYGTLPRLGLRTDNYTLSIFQGVSAIRNATTEMATHFARSQASRAITTQNGPDTTDIKNVPINSPVLVYLSDL